jgi:hypothetical protein
MRGSFGMRAHSGDQQACRFNLGRHIRQHKLNTLVIGDRLLKLDTLLSIRNREVERTLCNTYSLCCNARARAIQCHHCKLETITLTPQ